MSMTMEEFRAKMEWEGGSAALAEYGLKPEEAPALVQALYAELFKKTREVEKLADRIDNIVYSDDEETS